MLNSKKFLRFSMLILLPVLLLSGYVLSILWRVSVAEMELFGSSKLIPMKARKVYYPGPTDESTYFNNTYWYKRGDKNILVWTDKINCFQHVYGSALAAHELGTLPAHLLFCANEFAEFTFDWNGVSSEDLMDRRKDLAHNEVGRNLASKVEILGLKSKDFEQRLKAVVLEEINSPKRVYLSYRDPRVASLPSEDDFGCPGLPKKNVFNYLIDGASKFNIWSKNEKTIASEESLDL